MNEIKDTTANIVTIAGSGAAIMNWNEWLTLGLIISGIVLNIVRIHAIRSKKKDPSEN